MSHHTDAPARRRGVLVLTGARKTRFTGTPMKALKRMVGPEWRFRAHRLGRVRWLTKYRLMRTFQTDIGWRKRAAYVLFDPEIESFSYDLENEAETISALAAALGCPAEELFAYAAETRDDPELNQLLRRHIRWRLDVKRQPPLGNRLAWYVIVRTCKPKLIVETGIYLGLGSLTLLRALERNAEEGGPGELMSFDTIPSAGSVVRKPIRQCWRRFTGTTRDMLLPALEGRTVDMLFQDTPHTAENQRYEFGAAFAHAAPRLLLLDASGGKAPTLRAMCAERGGTYHQVPMHSRGHIYPGAAITFAVFDKPADAKRQGGR
jgi:Methyltransferase domain